eukprot:4845221-Amphidinium_carterae.1
MTGGRGVLLGCISVRVSFSNLTQRAQGTARRGTVNAKQHKSTSRVLRSAYLDLIHLQSVTAEYQGVHLEGDCYSRTSQG